MESETEKRTRRFALRQIIADPRPDRTGRVRGEDDSAVPASSGIGLVGGTS